VKFVKRFAFIFALIFSCLLAASAQTPQATPPPVEDDTPITIKSRLVVVPVSVLDAAGQPVTGLKAQDFRVLEENVLQEIAEVSDAEKVPLEIVLLFDISATTNPMFEFEQETAARFLQEVMRAEDRATIFTIGDRPMLIQARDTADKSAVAIKSIQPTKQYTAFYDAVYAASDYLRKNARQGTRRVIVAITDGEDTNSVRISKAIQDGYRKLGKKIDTMTSKEVYALTVKNRDAAAVSEQNRVLQALQNADAVFYSINPAGGSYQLNAMSRFGQSNLQKFADETGGTAFLPKFLPVNSKVAMQNSQNTRLNREALSKIFKGLTNELQAQYLVQYYSESEFPLNRYVRLNVNLQNPQNYRLRARKGYFVK
jgi:VWFA-related protein